MPPVPRSATCTAGVHYTFILNWTVFFLSREKSASEQQLILARGILGEVPLFEKESEGWLVTSSEQLQIRDGREGWDSAKSLVGQEEGPLDVHGVQN